MKPIVFSDIDGTLIDLESFDISPALKGISYLKKQNIPLVLCSAKTRAEQESIRKKVKLTDPFIVENGGAIYIPSFYFPFQITQHTMDSMLKGVMVKKDNTYTVLILGTTYSTIRQILDKIRTETGLCFKGFGDMTVEEVAKVTGLSLEEANAAKSREFDETLLLKKEEAEDLKRYLTQYGLTLVGGGRFYHVIGNSSKGRCVSILSLLFRKSIGKIITIGIGDNHNDLPMLRVVDIPILVEKKEGGWIEAPHIKRKVHKVQGIGPYGFTRAIISCLKKIRTEKAYYERLAEPKNPKIHH